MIEIGCRLRQKRTFFWLFFNYLEGLALAGQARLGQNCGDLSSSKSGSAWFLSRFEAG
jgi:hypothetical protein